jgi:hypothetical protein
MVRVRWSDEAEADLAAISPAAVRDQLRNNAERILHHPISPDADPEDEGIVDDGTMWHRADGHGRFAGGCEDYFLFYAKCDPPTFDDPEEDPEFEILAIRSVRQIACMWWRMGGDSGV